MVRLLLHFSQRVSRIERTEPAVANVLATPSRRSETPSRIVKHFPGDTFAFPWLASAQPGPNLRGSAVGGERRIRQLVDSHLFRRRLRSYAGAAEASYPAATSEGCKPAPSRASCGQTGSG